MLVFRKILRTHKVVIPYGNWERWYQTRQETQTFEITKAFLE